MAGAVQKISGKIQDSRAKFQDRRAGDRYIVRHRQRITALRSIGALTRHPATPSQSERSRAAPTELVMSTVFQLPRRNDARPARARGGALRRLARAGAGVVRDGARAWVMRQTIQKLESLDDRMLADLGLSRNEIEPWVRQYVMCDEMAGR